VLGDELANLEQEMETLDGRTDLNTKAELAQRETEIRSTWEPLPRRPLQPTLAPGAPVSLRGLAILRQRERDDNATP
jgi:hypothetical protein